MTHLSLSKCPYMTGPLFAYYMANLIVTLSDVLLYYI